MDGFCRLETKMTYVVVMGRCLIWIVIRSASHCKQESAPQRRLGFVDKRKEFILIKTNGYGNLFRHLTLLGRSYWVQGKVWGCRDAHERHVNMMLAGKLMGDKRCLFPEVATTRAKLPHALPLNLASCSWSVFSSPDVELHQIPFDNSKKLGCSFLARCWNRVYSNNFLFESQGRRRK